MSNENYNIDYESLEFFNTEIPNEDYYGETEIHEYDHYVYNDISSISSFNIEKEVEDEYSFIYDESELDKLLNLTNKIKRVESLRMELALMNHRKSIVMNILPKFFENGLVSIVIDNIMLNNHPNGPLLQNHVYVKNKNIQFCRSHSIIGYLNI